MSALEVTSVKTREKKNTAVFWYKLAEDLEELTASIFRAMNDETLKRLSVSTTMRTATTQKTRDFKTDIGRQ
jgi:hypothetical protein